MAFLQASLTAGPPSVAGCAQALCQLEFRRRCVDMPAACWRRLQQPRQWPPCMYRTPDAALTPTAAGPPRPPRCRRRCPPAVVHASVSGVGCSLERWTCEESAPVHQE